MYPIIHLFNYAIPTFGIMFLFGVGLAFLLATQTAEKYEIPTMDAMFFGLFALIGGIGGAKLLYIIVDFPNLIAHPESVFLLLTGGSVFYGGLIGGILGGFLYTRIYNLNTIQYFDMAVPCLALAQAFGRIGCFFNGCCYGIPYEGFCRSLSHWRLPTFWHRTFSSPVSRIPFSPCFNLCLVSDIKKTKTPGFATGFYLTAYGIFRFVNEFFRSDPRGSVFYLSTSQWISLLIIILGILFFFKLPQIFYEKHSKQ